MDENLTEKVIGAAFKVHNELVFGFLESVYEKALAIELSKTGIAHQTQAPINVIYDNQIVAEFVCDMLIEPQPIVELKSVTQSSTAHEVQLVNYLTATRIDIGLLINFGTPRVEVKRKFRTAKN
jgi:GxxExxY protein